LIIEDKTASHLKKRVKYPLGLALGLHTPVRILIIDEFPAEKRPNFPGAGKRKLTRAACAKAALLPNCP